MDFAFEKPKVNKYIDVFTDSSKTIVSSISFQNADESGIRKRMFREGDIIAGFKLGKIIGRGKFSVVYSVTCEKTGNKFAAKIAVKLPFNPSKYGHCDYRRELSMLLMLDHPNICKIHDYHIGEGFFMMVLPLFRTTWNLKNLSRDVLQNENAARGIMRQAVSALIYCHDRGVYHRDFKIDNILISLRGEVCLTDFGISSIAPFQGARIRGRNGSKLWVAPELYYRRVDFYNGEKSDAFSVGVLLFKLTQGKYPFLRRNGGDPAVESVRHSQPIRIQTGTRSLQDLLSRLLHPNPRRRIAVREIPSHSWYRRN